MDSDLGTRFKPDSDRSYRDRLLQRYFEIELREIVVRIREGPYNIDFGSESKCTQTKGKMKLLRKLDYFMVKSTRPELYFIFGFKIHIPSSLFRTFINSLLKYLFSLFNKHVSKILLVEWSRKLEIRFLVY